MGLYLGNVEPNALRMGSVTPAAAYMGAIKVWPALSAGAFEPIATVTVGPGGASSIEFTSIPGTYQHLQVRVISKSVNSAGDSGDLTFNGDTANNYAYHSLYGTGASAAAEAGTTRANIPSLRLVTSSSTSVFGAHVIDILDYASTSKNKTVRTFSGDDRNGSGAVFLNSGLWFATPAAVTSIKFTGRSFNIAEHSTAALYGIKA